MSERSPLYVALDGLAEEEKLALALELLEEPANLSVKDDVYGTLMEEAQSKGRDGWADHILMFLAIGTYVVIRDERP